MLSWKFQTNKNFNKLHLIIHQILTLETLLIFTKNILQNHILFEWLMLLLHELILHVSESIYKLIMGIDDKITDKKLQYDVNTEAAKISALSSGKR